MKEIFETIIAREQWRSGDTICGHGSTIQYTENIRNKLKSLLERHAIHSMLDAPCGDYGWMSKTELPADFQYIGGDIVGSLIEKNRQQHPTVKFCTIDITQDVFPDVDVLFCRDCLIHFSHSDIHRFFENFVRSNIKYLLMTSYKASSNNDINTGGFRGVDFTCAPYDFETPIDSIEDWISGYAPRAMCLWKRETIMDYLKK